MQLVGPAELGGEPAEVLGVVPGMKKAEVPVGGSKPLGRELGATLGMLPAHLPIHVVQAEVAPIVDEDADQFLPGGSAVQVDPATPDGIGMP